MLGFRGKVYLFLPIKRIILIFVNPVEVQTAASPIQTK